MGPPILDRDGARADVLTELQMPATKATYHRRSGLPDRRRGARALLALAASLLAAGACAAPAGAAGPARELVIEGAGEGHGVGMSQYGALGYARHGASYQQILAHYYTGTALGTAAAKTVVKVLIGSKVKRVPLERYVRGVVSAEMPSNWPAAALEAQAVASRTYALTDHAGGSRFDVYSDTRSQVYRGVAAETAATNAAVAATAGQIVTYGGRPAITYFFSSSGGMTEDSRYGFPGGESEPWLRAVADPYETSASHWRVEFSLSSAARLLKGLLKGSFVGIEVLRRGASPRVLKVRVMGSSGATVVSGPELAGVLGLPSTWDYFDLRSGSALTPEPDHSGRPRTWSPAAPATPVQPLPSTHTGGVPANGSAAAAGPSGGVAAG